MCIEASVEGDTAQCMFKYYHTRTRPFLSANELGPFPLALQIFCVALARNKWAGWHCAFHIYLPLRPLFLTILVEWSVARCYFDSLSAEPFL